MMLYEFSHSNFFKTHLKIPAEKKLLTSCMQDKLQSLSTNGTEVSHEGKDPRSRDTFQWNTGCLIGILISWVIIIPTKTWVGFHRPYNLTNQGFFPLFRWFKPCPFHPRIVGCHEQPLERVTFSQSPKGHGLNHQVVEKWPKQKD